MTLTRKNTKGDKRRRATLKRNLRLRRRASTTLSEATINAAAKLITEAELKAAATKDLKSCYDYYLEDEAEEYVYDGYGDYRSADDVEEHFFDLMEGDRFTDFTEEVGGLVWDAVDKVTDGEAWPKYDDDYAAVINAVVNGNYESTTQYVAQEGDYAVVSSMSRYVEKMTDEANEEMSHWESEKKSLEREYYDSVLGSKKRRRKTRKAEEEVVGFESYLYAGQDFQGDPYTKYDTVSDCGSYEEAVKLGVDFVERMGDEEDFGGFVITVNGEVVIDVFPNGNGEVHDTCPPELAKLFRARY